MESEKPSKKPRMDSAIKIPVSLATDETSERYRPPRTPPLTEENATTEYAIYALIQAKNGDLEAIVDLASGYSGCIANTEKAVVLFEEAAFSNDPHWLADAVFSLALQHQTVDTMFLQMEILNICPFFHFKILSMLSKDTAEINKVIRQLYIIPITALKKVKEGKRRGGVNVSLRYDEARDRCVQMAAELWKGKPLRISYVCEVIHETLRRKIDPCPKPDKIKDYLKAAEKEGLLSIPLEARKGGRPRNDED